MEMKKNISLLLCMLVLIVSCTKETLFDIPRDANGNAILTTVSSSTTTGISTLDDQFSVTATLPNAKVGDEMNVELLKLQTPSGGTTKQLLPMAGTQKQVTVGSDFKATVTYTRAEATLNAVGDYVEVCFNGETDYAIQRVDMVAATTVTNPMVSGEDIDVARTAETAYFNVMVEPKEAAYTGDLVAKRKNGVNEAWVDITGSPFTGNQPFLVPISGDDFAAGKDTMYYSFTAASGSYTDEITKNIIVRDPYFYLKKSATLTLNTTSDGIDLLINAPVADTAAVAADDNSAIVSVSLASGSLKLQGGSAWLAASVNNTIEFVPSTHTMYADNNSNDAIAAFEAGVAAGDETTTAGPLDGEGVYIFKVVNGTASGNIYYGMLKFITSSTNSVTFEYRIGNMYAHLAVIH